MENERWKMEEGEDGEDGEESLFVLFARFNGKFMFSYLCGRWQQMNTGSVIIGQTTAHNPSDNGTGSDHSGSSSLVFFYLIYFANYLH